MFKPHLHTGNTAHLLHAGTAAWLIFAGTCRTAWLLFAGNTIQLLYAGGTLWLLYVCTTFSVSLFVDSTVRLPYAGNMPVTVWLVYIVSQYCMVTVFYNIALVLNTESTCLSISRISCLAKFCTLS